MLQRYKSVQLPLLIVTIFSLLIGVSLVAKRRFSKPAPVVTHRVDTVSEDALAYWTADKMRTAKGTNMPNVKVPKKGKKHSHRSHHS